MTYMRDIHLFFARIIATHGYATLLTPPLLLMPSDDMPAALRAA